MKPKTFMLIAGEASGDLLAAELISTLRDNLPEAKFFGAGGAKMAASGVDLAFDMTQLAVTGLTDVLKNYFTFRQRFKELLALAIKVKPDAIIGVDYGGFNLRFGHAIKEHVRASPQHNGSWNPKIIQFVSPQVWASRPKRANQMEADYDLLLSIFPFEKNWYAKRTPKLRVEFVGHPILDRERRPETTSPKMEIVASAPNILLLPGSRKGELKKHLPPMLGALKQIQNKHPAAKTTMVLPNANLVGLAKSLGADLEIQTGNLPSALSQADVAIASTGTVTMECAFYGVPTVTLYKTSWLTYEIGKRLITVSSLTMPNLLASETVYPEFIQDDATAEKLAAATIELLQNTSRREQIKARLGTVVASLGEPGATKRAANAILSLFP